MRQHNYPNYANALKEQKVNADKMVTLTTDKESKEEQIIVVNKETKLTKDKITKKGNMVNIANLNTGKVLRLCQAEAELLLTGDDNWGYTTKQVHSHYCDYLKGILPVPTFEITKEGDIERFDDDIKNIVIPYRIKRYIPAKQRLFNNRKRTRARRAIDSSNILPKLKG